jgi:hypothetical protein
MQVSSCADALHIDPTAKAVVVPAAVTSLESLMWPDTRVVEVLQFEPGSKLSKLAGSTGQSFPSLKFICIPSSVRVIESMCFFSIVCTTDPPLEVIAFEAGSNLREIQPFALAGCYSLKSICLPVPLEQADGQSFCECGLTRISFEEGNDTFVSLATSLSILRGFGLFDILDGIARFEFRQALSVCGSSASQNATRFCPSISDLIVQSH